MLKVNLSKQCSLLNQSISSLNRMLRAKTITPIELTQACLERIEETKVLNAFITVAKDVALAQADESTQRYQHGKHLSNLDGIPISFKDNFNTRHLRTTCASKMLANHRPPYNATVVQRLLDQGGILIGKTNLDEFGMGSACSESYFGPTYNLWKCSIKVGLYNQSLTEKLAAGPSGDEMDKDSWYIPGGSSGGSAISVATGASLASLSSDTGGSTRNPASRVGIVGFKPSYGVISRYGLIPLTHSLDVPGIMARSVEDVTTVFDYLHGIDQNDSTTVDVKLEPTTSEEMPPHLSGVTIGIPEEYRCDFIDNSILQAWDEAIALLAKAGARIVSVSLPHTKYSLACYSILNTCEVASNFACYDGVQYGHRTSRDELNFEDCYTATRDESLNDIVKSRIIAGNYFLLSQNYQVYYRHALQVRRLISQDFEQVFGNVDYLLTPVTISKTMNYSEWNRLDKTEEVIKEDYCTQPTNMAGLPAISLPARIDPQNSLPIGLQLIGNKFGDYRLLQLAEKVEKLFNFPKIVIEK